jgi:solute carrier family 35 protein E1
MAKSSSMADKLALVLLYVFWFVGNYYYNLYNKQASMKAGGKDGGLTVTISVMQIVVCAAWAMGLWLIRRNPTPLLGLKAPAPQPLPAITKADVISLLPLTFCYAFAHTAGVVALTAGSPAFGQIVKAAEPVFAAVINTLFYAKSPSLAKWCVLPVIVGGVAISTLKKESDGSYSVPLDLYVLAFGSVNNVFAAFKGSENHRAMAAPGLKDRIGGVGNQFALTNVLSLVFLVPCMVLSEGANWPKFVDLFTNDDAFRWNLCLSGITFYLYNELATMTIKATGAVTASVANTAKRAIVIVGMAIALGNPLKLEEKVGASTAIAGVFLYSVIDELLGKKGAGAGPKVNNPMASPAMSTRSRTKKVA